MGKPLKIQGKTTAASFLIFTKMREPQRSRVHARRSRCILLNLKRFIHCVFSFA